MEFRILGPLQAVDNGRAVPLGGAKQRALLTLLLLHANETISRDRLIDELWGARPPATAAKTVQVHISRLRKALEDSPVLMTREHGYTLAIDPEALDAKRFERLLGVGSRELAAGRPDHAVPALEVGALAVAWLAAVRSRARAVRAVRDRAARGVTAGSARAADRGKARAAADMPRSSGGSRR